MAGELEEAPTAKQLVELVHDTPLRKTSVAPLKTGLGTIDHVEPSQCSISGFAVKVVSVSVAMSPTAKQLVGLGHETLKSPASAPALAPGTIDQVEPFQCSNKPGPDREAVGCARTRDCGKVAEAEVRSG